MNWTQHRRVCANAGLDDFSPLGKWEWIKGRREGGGLKGGDLMRYGMQVESGEITVSNRSFSENHGSWSFRAAR
jgi:hypothetical protein